MVFGFDFATEAQRAQRGGYEGAVWLGAKRGREEMWWFLDFLGLAGSTLECSGRVGWEVRDGAAVAGVKGGGFLWDLVGDPWLVLNWRRKLHQVCGYARGILKIFI